jgi:4-hydroxy-tetrahydrodipicolinate synthase
MVTEIKGIITALITPFDDEGRIDDNGLRVLIKRQIDQGVHGIAITAGSGEYVNLSDTERSRVVEISAKAVNGRIPLIVGDFAPNTHDAVEWAKKAAGLGADALLVLTPLYNKPSMDGLIAHFRAIGKATPLPMLVYNNPGRTGINLLPQDYIQLAEIPTICGIKECNRDLGILSQTLTMLGSRWNSILFGDDDILYLALELGVRGGVITTSNIFPSRWVNMYNAIMKGDHDTAKAIHYEVLPYFNAIYTYNHPALIKATLRLLGLPAGHTRPPLADPPSSEHDRVQSLIAEMQLTK